MKSLAKATLAAVAGVGMTVVGMETASALSLITVSYSGNDCSGVFGRFAECYVSPPNSSVRLSPIIAKFNVGETTPAINTSMFPTVTGQEWSFSPIIAMASPLVSPLAVGLTIPVQKTLQLGTGWQRQETPLICFFMSTPPQHNREASVMGVIS